MSSRSQSVRSGYGRTIVMILLAPITTLNASQALTLCMDHDGHMALELLVQDRCTCEIRTSGADAPGETVAGSLRVADGLDSACLDIPIPGGSCDNRITTNYAPINRRQRQIALGGMANPLGQAFVYVNPTIHKPGGLDATIESLSASVSYYTPLDSILLLV